MNRLPAQELKRRGIAALEESLLKGPVHIIKNNRPVCVVISTEDYARLEGPLSSQNTSPKSLWAWVKKPSLNRQSEKQIDRRLAKQRNEWDK